MTFIDLFHTRFAQHVFLLPALVVLPTLAHGVGCVSVEPPDDAEIQCETDADCPDEWVCFEAIARCVQDDVLRESDIPEVVSGSLDVSDEDLVVRGSFKLGSTIRVAFQSSIALGVEPRISLGKAFGERIDGGINEAEDLSLMVFDSEASQIEENRYVFHAVVDDTMNEGPMRLFIEMLNEFGKQVTFELTTVELDFTAPTLVSPLSVSFAEEGLTKAQADHKISLSATGESDMILTRAVLLSQLGEELVAVPVGNAASEDNGLVYANAVLSGAIDLSLASLEHGDKPRVKVFLEDAAGNPLAEDEQLSPVIEIDTESPIAPSLSIEEANTQNKVFSFGVTLLASTGGDGQAVWIEGDVVDSDYTFAWVPYQPDYPVTLTEEDGIKEIKVKLKDYAANESEFAELEVALEASQDEDLDGCVDAIDPNPLTFSADGDGDGRGDDCDECQGNDVSGDTDGDLLCDDVDPDIDNDGCANDTDLQPLIESTDSDGDGFGSHCDLCTGNDVTGDTDGDLVCDDEDEDKDGDGCADVEDPAPFLFSLDPDGDHLGADCDLCNGQDATGDTDSDGLCDDIDQDDDGDGCVDGADPAALAFSPDSDVDGFGDDCDLCSGDDATGDTDMDGICDQIDEDKDGDGCLNDNDIAPLSVSADDDNDGFGAHCDLCTGDDASGDNDSDGTCDDMDPDDDNDGCTDEEDSAPLVASEDTDNDGRGTHCDICTGDDASGDNDSDGTCDDQDTDDDNDGCLDLLESEETRLVASADDDEDGKGADCDPCFGTNTSGDTDEDGICDAEDPDDDNDGCLDDDDPLATVASVDEDDDGVSEHCDLCNGDDASGDTDGDGTCDNLDPDDDNDGCVDEDDSVPLIASEDTDNDGRGAHCDTCIGEDSTGDNDSDGTCNDIDPDDDNDDCADVEDPAPLVGSPDSDDDGSGSDCDPCFGTDSSGDTDEDGICDAEDPDDDNDGCQDVVDENSGLLADSLPTIASLDEDGDGVAEHCDLCMGNDASGDLDGDGTCNDMDPDDDNDGCLDGDDSNPLVGSDDTDNDGRGAHCDSCIGEDSTGDNDSDGTCDDQDTDDDNDGCLDVEDSEALIASSDVDNDGKGSDCDPCLGDALTGNTDGDAFCDDLDTDDDNDGCPDEEDTLPKIASTDLDEDGVPAHCDLCNGDDARGDTDGDGDCNDVDTDDDNDGCADDVDPYALIYLADDDGDLVGEDCDVCEGDDHSGDADGDGICNSNESDDDNDGCPDGVDANPTSYSSDTDGDGDPQDCDPCYGVGVDTDGDLYCDDTDPDDDNDGCFDGEDPFPLIAGTDTDEDGLANYCDDDDDNDGCPDTVDTAPLEASPNDQDQDGVADECDLCSGDDATGDTDNDGDCDNLDDDDDNDGCVDADDAYPARHWGDADGDGATESYWQAELDIDGDNIPNGCDDFCDSEVSYNYNLNASYEGIQSAIGCRKLSGLSIVCDSTAFSDCAASDLTPLNDLMEISTGDGNFEPWMNIEGVKGLVDLSAMPNLKTMNGVNISIHNNPDLETLQGLEQLSGSLSELVITSNPKLRHIDELALVSGFTRGVHIQSNALLTNVDGLIQVSSAPVIYIRDNASLFSMNAFSEVAFADAVIIADNPQLQDLAGFANLEYVGREITKMVYQNNNWVQAQVPYGFELRYNTALNDLSSLSNLTTAQTLYVNEMSTLTSLQGLENLQQVGDLLIMSNYALTSMSALASLASAETIHLYSNGSLTDIAMPSLGAANLGAFTITYNHTLSEGVIDALDNQLTTEYSMINHCNNLGDGNQCDSWPEPVTSLPTLEDYHTVRTDLTD